MADRKKRWVLRLELTMTLRQLGLATGVKDDSNRMASVVIEAAYGTKAELRKMYLVAKAQVGQGKLTRAAAFDQWDASGKPMAEAKR